ncbi:MAG: hypothetical protein M9909_01045 [Thermomicrobiales bacterium]|nr:hypothetical protein [Thermomicrobiales bacterium]
MPLTRRSLVASSMLLPFATRMPVGAIDSDWLTSAIVNVFDLLPDRPGPGRLEFPVTTGIDYLVQREVWPENPDTYWDPKGADISAIFGFYPGIITLAGTQGDVSIWEVPNNEVDLDVTRETLVGNGWVPVDEDLGILHYAGNEDERGELAASLNILQDLMREGVWDWVAIPDIATIVTGANAEVVRQVADRVKHYPPMSTIAGRFHGLKPLLTPETYEVTLLPPQALAVAMTESTFVGKSWTGDVPIVQSIGLRLDSPDQVEPMIATINQRLEQEISPVSGERYSDYLELIETNSYYSSVRLDFVDHSGDWDVTRAWSTNDLGMLPPTDN